VLLSLSEKRGWLVFVSFAFLCVFCWSLRILSNSKN
jgi:hypothetical protein